MAKLKELAKVIRSKNSGPYEITFDIMFPDRESYDRVKESGVLTGELIGRLYHVKEEDIIVHMFFDPALAYKFTLRRPARSLQGSIGENDTFGTQQHVPLLEVEIP